MYWEVRIEMPPERLITNAMDKVIKSVPVISFFFPKFYMYTNAIFPVTGFNQILPSPSDLGATFFISQLKSRASH